MYKKILVGTDGSPSADAAVAHAVHLAAATGAEVMVLSAIPLAQTMGAGLVPVVPDPQPLLDVAHKVVQAAEERHAGPVRITPMVREGDPATMLLDTAEREGADLIVVGSRGMSGIARFLLGSVPSRVAHHATCDVLIVHTT